MSTALELGKQGWKPYINKARIFIKEKKEDPFISKVRLNLLDKVKDAANVLRKKYHVTNIILFGSLAHKIGFSQYSDIDIAVEGILPHEYWQIWNFFEDEITDFPVNVVDYNDVAEPVKQSIQRNGIYL